MQLANNKKKEEEITINIQNNHNFLKRTVIGKFVFNDDSLIRIHVVSKIITNVLSFPNLVEVIFVLITRQIHSLQGFPVS